MNERKTELDLFVEEMKISEDIAIALKNREDDDGEIKDKAKKAICREGYNESVREGVPHGFTSLDYKDQHQYELGQHYAQLSAGKARQRAARNFRENLEEMVKKIEDKKLEGMLGNEEMLTKLASHTKGYEEWVQKNLIYQNRKELAKKAAMGRLNEEEREALIEPIAQAEADKQRKKHADAGYDSDIQNTAGALASAAVKMGAGRSGKAYKNAAEAVVKQAQKDLKKYESDSKKDIYGFMSTALRDMMKTKEGRDEARNIVYTLGKR